MRYQPAIKIEYSTSNNACIIKNNVCKVLMIPLFVISIFYFLTTGTNLHQIPKLTYLAFALFSLLSGMVMYKYSIKADLSQILWSVFFLLYLLTLPFRIIPYNMFVYTIFIYIIFASSILLSNNFIWKNIFSYTIIIAALINVIFVIATIFMGNKLYLQLSFMYRPDQLKDCLEALYYGNYPGLVGEVSFSAYLSLCAIICVLSKIRPGNSKKSVIAILFTMLMLFNIILTNKRSFLLISLGVLFCYVCIFISKISKNKSRDTILFSFIGIVFIIICLALFKDKLVEYYDRFFNNDDFSSGRGEIFNIALRIFRENPIFGIGYGTFRFYIVEHNYYYMEIDVHNMYLKILCECGLIGFIPFIIAIGYTFINTFTQLYNIKNYSDFGKELIILSFLFQVMYLIYGLVGNNFTHLDQIFSYFMIISLNANINYLKNKKVEGVKICY